MTSISRDLRMGERMALRLFVLLGCAAIFYWSFRIGTTSFEEPHQVAVVGHDAPWRVTSNKRHVVAVGTDRRTHDIVLYDRKASPSHLLLERKGGPGRWWAHVYNHSPDRGMLIHRNGKDTGGGQGPSRIQVNRYRLRDGDRFLVPISVQKGQPARPKDSCSPTSVLQWLRSHRSPTPGGQKTLVSFTVEQVRQPFRVSATRGVMFWGTGSQKRSVQLDESQRYTLPKQAGGGFLEYRYGRWQRWKKDRWYSISDEGIQWGSPKRSVRIERRPHIAFTPMYKLGLSDSPCRWPLRPRAIPAGVELGAIARLQFSQNRLSLQHMGQHPEPLQIVPRTGASRLLGTATVFSGDFLTVGQLTYRVVLQKERVRLMLIRRPQSFLFPFFNTFPSEHLPMRKHIPLRGSLLLTGGEGTDNGAKTSERWSIPLPLLGTLGKTQVRSPYRPFILIQRTSKGALQLRPVGDAHVYAAQTDGTLLPKRIQKISLLRSKRYTLYSKRLYLRIFRPSYGGLAWRIALIWMLFAGGLLYGLTRWIHSGRIPIVPCPRPLPLTHAPLHAGAHGPTTCSDAGYTFWKWFPFWLLFPLALFLNGLGLYVLASLSLSSLGLNNHSFLYRQLLWSVVGVSAFVLVVGWPQKGWQILWRHVQSWPFVGRCMQWLQARRPERIQGVQILGIDTTPSTSWTSILWSGLFVMLCALSMGWLFKSSMMFFPIVLIYAYGLLLRWEWKRSHYHTERRASLRYFFLTLFLLGFVPIIGLLVPPLVHNRFFLKVPGVGTVKLSEFAILAAILFFSSFLGLELFALRRVKYRLRNAKGTKNNTTASTTEMSADTEETNSNDSTTPDLVSHVLPIREASSRRQKLERIGGALSTSFLYLLLLGAIGLLYTAQGDLGPGLILTVCFSFYLLFAFSGSGADKWTTWGNLSRIGFVLGGLLLLITVPTLLATLFPEWVQNSSELQKVNERLSLWQQPWRFIVGEQILQNLWSLSRFNGSFQWFNNLHSDFVLTGVVGVLSPIWGYVLIGISCVFPLAALRIARLYWHPVSSYDSPELTAQKERDMLRSLVVLFGGIYLFAQNFIHIGSVLRLTPMTGVTFTWVSSGGTSLVVCYLVLGMMYRQLRILPGSTYPQENP